MTGWQQSLLGFAAGLLISLITAPVGISGAVFLLPVQLDILRVPNPQVTPTNLLYNVVSVPGALFRYRRQRQLAGPLTRALIAGTLPGVVIGAVIRVYLVPGAGTFRLLAAALLLPLGIWILARTKRPGSNSRAGAAHQRLTGGRLTGLALATGLVGGIYGIGGGSILGPVLVGAGFPLMAVAPAALASTFLTSVVGAVSFAVIALSATGKHLSRLAARSFLWIGWISRRLPRCPAAAAFAGTSTAAPARRPGGRTGGHLHPAELVNRHVGSGAYG